jgi:predicted CXXCH cytochrome family protein
VFLGWPGESITAAPDARQKPYPGGVASQPVINAINVSTQSVAIDWHALRGPFQVQGRPDLISAQWQTVGTSIEAKSIQLPVNGTNHFYRVISPEIDFVGAAVCVRCHLAIHTNWAQTTHATALETLKAVQQDTNAACLGCHTVGFGLPTGFKDEATTPHLAGVQCENCHGPAGDHVMFPYDVQPVVRLDSEMCGGCHSGPHHDTYAEWKLARHSQTLPTVQQSPFAQNDCLQCHSEDYRNAAAAQDVLPTLTTAHFSVECATCHAPHGGVAQLHLLRQPVIDLCGGCHTQGEVLLGQSPHHPQAEMLKGIGAFNTDGTALVTDAPHGPLVVSNACAQCHVVRHEVSQPNEGNPVVTGHTFNPFDTSIKDHQPAEYDGCLICHLTERAADTARKNLQQEISGRLEALAGYFDPRSSDYIDPSTLNAAQQQQLQVAQFNYEFVTADKSVGVHNASNARTSLTIAEDIIKTLRPSGGKQIRRN